MSDRREAVARALHAHDVHLREEEGDFGVKTAPWDETGEYTREMFREYADAAIAAMEAEPTETEVEAARQEYITKRDAYIEEAKANAVCQSYSRDDYPECVEMIYDNAGYEAMRAALIAARTARPGGQR